MTFIRQCLFVITMLLCFAVGCGRNTNDNSFNEPERISISTNVLVGEWQGIDTKFGSICMLVLTSEEKGWFIEEWALSKEGDIKPVLCQWEIRNDKTIRIMVKEADAQAVINSFSGYLYGDTSKPAMRLVASTEDASFTYLFRRTRDIETNRHKWRQYTMKADAANPEGREDSPSGNKQGK